MQTPELGDKRRSWSSWGKETLVGKNRKAARGTFGRKETEGHGEWSRELLVGWRMAWFVIRN